MRTSELIKKLEECGFYFLRAGGRHDIYTNGKVQIPVARHKGKEVPTGTAKSILKKAKMHSD